MTSTAASRPSRPIDHRFLLWATGISAVLTLAMLAVAAPGGRLLDWRHPPVRPHAPELWRIGTASPAIQWHMVGVAAALVVGLILLAGVKGRTMHRVLGWTWVVAMGLVAVSSLFIRMVNHGQLSWLHLFTGWTLIALPMGVAFARTHRVRLHARTMTGLFVGGLVVAGLFTVVPGRLMWQVFFG
jgi:uncharacterized membrane protein